MLRTRELKVWFFRRAPDGLVFVVKRVRRTTIFYLNGRRRGRGDAYLIFKLNFEKYCTRVFVVTARVPVYRSRTIIIFTGHRHFTYGGARPQWTTTRPRDSSSITNVIQRRRADRRAKRRQKSISHLIKEDFHSAPTLYGARARVSLDDYACRSLESRSSRVVYAKPINETRRRPGDLRETTLRAFQSRTHSRTCA